MLCKKSVSACALVGMISLVFSVPARAAVLYSNLVAAPSLTGDQSVNGTNGAIFDDVLIDNFVHNPGNLDYIEVASITVGILRDTGAAAVTVTGYFGTTTTPANPNAFPILNNPQTAFGSLNIPAYAGVGQTVEYYTITPGSPFLVPLNLTDQPTFSEFAIGLQFSNQSANGWAVALPDMPDTNLDGAWDSNLVSNTNVTYALDLNGQPLYTTFALEIQGVLLPEPSTAGLLALGAVYCARRRSSQT